LLAGTASQSDPLPVSLFSTESTPQGFITAALPVPETWMPGLELFLRGPLGRGFSIPASARRVALLSLEGSPARLLGLVAPALKQGAAVVIASDVNEGDLPDEVEVQPLSALGEAADWADYVALDVSREKMHGLKERLSGQRHFAVKNEAQVLIHTLMPCGGIAECGVCAVMTPSNWKMACKDGPVFSWREI
jgi:NAD(P)H-flavin reductase